MNPTEIALNKSEDEFKQLCYKLKMKFEDMKKGGGQKNIDKEHGKGKLIARERIEYLIDQGTEFLDIGTFAGDGMYEEYGGCPGGGVLGGIGRVQGDIVSFLPMMLP